MPNSVFTVDTNVLIYLHDNSNSGKRDIAKNLLTERPQIPAQVISEYLNTTRRLLVLTKDELLIQASELFSDCIIIPTLPATLHLAADIGKIISFNYSMQL